MYKADGFTDAVFSKFLKDLQLACHYQGLLTELHTTSLYTCKRHQWTNTEGVWNATCEQLERCSHTLQG